MLVTFGTLAFFPPVANAWNSAGHRLCALIAWQRLDDNTRQAISGLLEHHPDHRRWIESPAGATPEVAAFLAASTWPDDIKNDKRFHDESSDAPPPLLPGFPDMARHRHWHYIDHPLGNPPSPQDTHGELDRQLDRLIRVVGDRQGDDLQRAYA
ncbi:MAG: S1/P1 nuclease, partial [Burkholderiales bacterium]